MNNSIARLVSEHGNPTLKTARWSESPGNRTDSQGASIRAVCFAGLWGAVGSAEGIHKLTPRAKKEARSFPPIEAQTKLGLSDVEKVALFAEDRQEALRWTPHAPIFGRSAVAESLSPIPDRISDKEHIAGQLIEPCGKQ